MFKGFYFQEIGCCIKPESTILFNFIISKVKECFIWVHPILRILATN